MELAFKLLFVGMITVFAALFIVVFVGNIIIRFVNRFVQGDEAIVSNKVAATTIAVVDNNKMAAIVSAVNIITKGKGTVVDVKKA